MNLLLDTHVFIWMDSEANRLSITVAEMLQEGGHTLYLSFASIWEMQIKYQLGKLSLERSLADIIRDQQAQNSLQLLPITLQHILGLDELPLHHRDPFDRLIISQAKVENFTPVTHDAQLEDYDIKIIW